MSRQKEDPIIYLYRDSFPDFARMIRRSIVADENILSEFP